MGLLDLILGQQNPISQWADANPSLLANVGAGFASGTNLGQGLANAASGAATAKPVDRAFQLQVQQRNATADWLQQIGRPDLAALAATGGLSSADLAGAMLRAPTVLHPGDSLVPGSFGLGLGAGPPGATPQVTPSPTNGAPPTPATSQQPSYGTQTSPGTAAGVAPANPILPASAAGLSSGGNGIYRAPANNVEQMTMQERQALADSGAVPGAVKGTAAYGNFILAGKVPEPPPGYRFGPAGADGQPTLLPVQGGDADPANPLNANKVMGANPNPNLGLGQTGNPAIDPSQPGYATKPVAAGLTQQAIDQQALAHITAGTTPAPGRAGIGGTQSTAVTNRMAELSQNANLASNRAQLKSLSSALNDQMAYLNNTQRAFQTANDTLASLQQFMVANKINPNQFPDYNNFVNAMQAHSGGAGIIAGYNAQLETVRKEYSQVLAKGGQRSDATDRAANALIPDGLPPAQLAIVAQQINVDSQNAISDAKKQVDQISGQINGIANGPSSANQPIVKSLGGINYSSPDGGKTWYTQ